MSELPPLPSTDWQLHMPAGPYEPAWTSCQEGFAAEYMIAYAAAARLAALEEAADVCDQHASCEGIAEKCAAAIRALAIHVPPTCTDCGEK